MRHYMESTIKRARAIKQELATYGATPTVWFNHERVRLIFTPGKKGARVTVNADGKRLTAITYNYAGRWALLQYLRAIGYEFESRRDGFRGSTVDRYIRKS